MLEALLLLLLLNAVELFQLEQVASSSSQAKNNTRRTLEDDAGTCQVLISNYFYKQAKLYDQLIQDGASSC